MCVTFNNYLNLIFICLPIGIIQGVPTVDSNRSVIASETSQVLEHCNKQNLFELPDIGAITELVARDCDIEELENAFFIRFTSLESLEISDSGLSTLQDYALHGLNNLKTLSLARNNLSEVRSWSNEPMSALISLDLRRNNIRELTLKSFIRYPNLQRLNLAVNLLEDIDDGIFRWMPHLKYLNLGKNRLLSIDNRNFHGMHSLGYLALHFNGLQDIEANSFSTNSHLRTLRLEGNKLADLDFLNISLVRLAHLNLSNNALESLELLTFSKDYNLTTLDVSFNNLKEVQVGTFSGLKSLENLNISHNSLTEIELGSFNDLHSLLRIDLSHNRLIKLPTNIFRTTTHLQHINLSNNTLHTLNDTIFSGMSHLHVLNLSANLLSRIDDCLEHLDSDLQRAEMSLDLSDNQFQLVNISTLADFQEVALAGNRWSCKWLIQEMLRIPHTIHFERKFAVLTASSSGVLDVSGIDCFDIERQRSIVILDTGRVWMQQRALECGQNDQQSTPTVPPLHWPRIPTDKFDSRSVIIWMLIAIALAFSGLRIARHLVEQKEHKKKLKAIRDEHIAQNMENEKLNNDLNQP